MSKSKTARTAPNGRMVRMHSLFRRQGRNWKRMSDMGLPLDIATFIWRDVVVPGVIAIRKTGVKSQSVITVSGRRTYVRSAA